MFIKSSAKLILLCEEARRSFEFARDKMFNPNSQDDREGVAWLLEGELQKHGERAPGGDVMALVEGMVLAMTFDDVLGGLGGSSSSNELVYEMDPGC